MPRESRSTDRSYIRMRDTTGREPYRGSEDVDALNEYLAERFTRTLRCEPEGALAEAMGYQYMNGTCVVVHTYSADATERDASSVEGFRIPNMNENRRITEPSVILAESLPREATFRDIGDFVEDRIIDLPRNAVDFLERFVGDLPPSLKKFSSWGHFRDTNVSADTRFSRLTLRYQMKDYRHLPLEECLRRAHFVYGKLHEAAGDGRYAWCGVDTHPKDEWLLRVHKFRRDYARRFKALVRELGPIKGLRFLSEDADPPEGYEHDEDDDALSFIAPYEEHSLEFSGTLIGEFRARAEMLLEEYERVYVSLSPLRPAYDEEEDSANGEFLSHPDLEERYDVIEGVAAEIFVKPKSNRPGPSRRGVK